jgi:hypothetical protein
MRVSIVFAGLMLSGCGQVASQKPAPPQTPPQAVTIPEVPTGRYQMVPASEGAGVYVLDTRNAMISRCFTTATNQTWCTSAVDSMAGHGPPF